MSPPQWETPLKLLFCNVLHCFLWFSFVFMISSNLHPFNHVAIFENQNKPWRLGWRSKEASYHHFFFFMHQKKSWTYVAWHVVIMQQPVLCMPLVGHFLPTASTKTRSTRMQNCWFTGWHCRKNSFWRIASMFKKTDNMLLKSDFICLLSWMAGGWLSQWDECCFIPVS